MVMPQQVKQKHFADLIDFDTNSVGQHRINNLFSKAVALRSFAGDQIHSTFGRHSSIVDNTSCDQ